MLSYSILDGMFPASLVGRANSALNVLHLTAAWAVQAGMGIVVARWAVDERGHYPVLAYRAAFAVPLAAQIAAMVWFILMGHAISKAQPAPRLKERIARAE